MQTLKICIYELARNTLSRPHVCYIFFQLDAYSTRLSLESCLVYHYQHSRQGNLTAGVCNAVSLAREPFYFLKILELDGF